MSKKCCIPNCRRQKDDPGCLQLNFFQVPSNENTQKQWSRKINQHFNKEIELKKYTYVCALHFEPTCFNYSELHKILRLKKGSCPTIFENYLSTERQVRNIIEMGQDNPIDKPSSISINNHLNDNEMSVSANAATVLSASMIYPSKIYDQTPDANAKLQSSDLQDDSHLDPLDDLVDTEEVSQISELHDDSHSGLSNDVANTVEVSQISEMNQSSSDKIAPDKSLMNKSLANINLDLIDYADKTMMRRILQKAQEEIIHLRRYRRVQAMRLYRAKKKVKHSGSLISHIKQRHLITDKVSEIVKVSTADI